MDEINPLRETMDQAPLNEITDHGCVGDTGPGPGIDELRRAEESISLGIVEPSSVLVIKKFYAVVVPCAGMPEVIEADTEKELAEKLVNGPLQKTVNLSYPKFFVFYGVPIEITRYNIPVIEINGEAMQYGEKT